MRYLLLVLLYIYRLLSLPLHLAAKNFGFESPCRFGVSCSEYSKNELEKNPSLMVALRKIAVRIISCGPWSAIFIRN